MPCDKKYSRTSTNHSHRDHFLTFIIHFLQTCLITNINMYYYIPFVVELAIEKLKYYKSPGINHIPAELIKARSRTICYKICKLMSIWNKEELHEEWKDSNIVPFYKRVIKQTVVIIGAYHFCQLHTKFYPTSCCQDQLYMQRKLLGIIKVDFDATDQLLIIYSAFVIYLRKYGNTTN